MEPLVSTLVLHPAVLIASGFDSLSSKQVRFLNAFRHHFANSSQSLKGTIVLKQSDFELGGIGNPNSSFRDPSESFLSCASTVDHFPYLSREEIVSAFYMTDLKNIWAEILYELYKDLDQFCLNHNRTSDYLQPTTQVVHQLYKYPIYQKITALHLCGLGQKMMDAFSFVFDNFKRYQKPV